jgi:hypothetical protein
MPDPDRPNFTDLGLSRRPFRRALAGITAAVAILGGCSSENTPSPAPATASSNSPGSASAEPSASLETLAPDKIICKPFDLKHWERTGGINIEVNGIPFGARAVSRFAEVYPEVTADEVANGRSGPATCGSGYPYEAYFSDPIPVTVRGIGSRCIVMGIAIHNSGLPQEGKLYKIIHASCVPDSAI